MATKSVKFKISVKELSVEFEGDLQMADQFQRQVTSALSGLASVQSRMLPSGSHQPQDRAIDVTPSQRRRRRRVSSSRAESSAATNKAADDGSSGEPDEETPRQANRRSSSGSAARELISALRDEGFFSVPRTIAEIRTELEKGGHTFKSNELSPPLGRLTRKRTLKRNRNDAGLWAYYAD